MSDLINQIQGSLQEAEQCRQTLAVARQRALQAQTECDHATASHEADQQRVRLALQALRDNVEVRLQSADPASLALVGECEEWVRWAQETQKELAQRAQAIQQQLNQAVAQIHHLQGDLEDKRRLVSLELTKNIALVENETRQLDQQLAATQSHVSEQLLPGLQRRQAVLTQQGADLRALVLQRLLPELTREFESTRRHLLQLSESLDQAGPGTAADARQAAQDSLSQLSESLQTMCARSAQAARASLDQWAANIPPVRARVDELNKQAKTFQELGTPAAGHLKMLVNVVAHLQDLLIQAKVLSDLG